MALLPQSDKTMTELEIDANQRIGEWDVIQEAGSALTPVYGGGYTGMINLGNSCYMNSVMQVGSRHPNWFYSNKIIKDLHRVIKNNKLKINYYVLMHIILIKFDINFSTYNLIL